MSNFGIVEEIFNKSVSSDTNTRSINIQKCVSYGFQLVTTNQSGFSATLTLEGSLDGIEWIPVPDSSQAHTGNDKSLYDVTRTAIAFVRLVISSVAGSADVVVKVYAKGN